MVSGQQGLELDTPGRSVSIELPWPPTVNTYWDKMPLVPGHNQMRDKFSELQGDWPAFRKWVMGNTRQIMKVSDRGKAFRTEVIARVLQARLNIGLRGPLSMSFKGYPPDKRERDLDNIYKPLQDALQHAGVYYSDFQIAQHKDCRRMDEVVKKVGLLVLELEPLVY